MTDFIEGAAYVSPSRNEVFVSSSFPSAFQGC